MNLSPPATPGAAIAPPLASICARPSAIAALPSTVTMWRLPSTAGSTVNRSIRRWPIVRSMSGSSGALGSGGVALRSGERSNVIAGTSASWTSILLWT